MFDGAILIDKKKYITSNKVLSLFKNKTGIKKAGIFGILDPLASGTLPIIFGQATKYIPYLLNDKKNYFLATIEFSKLSQSKLSVKPYFNNFSPFQINANLLNISGKILWQCSKIFSK